MTVPAFSLARRLAAGEIVHTAWCGLPCPLITETMARDGFRAVTIDQQHGLWDVAGTRDAIATIHMAGAAPIVRVPVGDFATVSRALDFGAEGVIAPMINTLAEARAFVAAAKYPPLGERSWGPHRALALAGMTDQKAYLDEANALTVTFAMIETRTALSNLDVIMATPGIDGVFLGPSDLSIALSGGTALDPHSKEVEKEVDVIAKAAAKATKIAGAYCASAERANELTRRGYRFMAIGSDLGFLRGAATAVLQKLKG